MALTLSNTAQQRTDVMTQVASIVEAAQGQWKQQVVQLQAQLANLTEAHADDEDAWSKARLQLEVQLNQAQQELLSRDKVNDSLIEESLAIKSKLANKIDEIYQLKTAAKAACTEVAGLKEEMARLAADLATARESASKVAAEVEARKQAELEAAQKGAADASAASKKEVEAHARNAARYRGEREALKAELSTAKAELIALQAKMAAESAASAKAAADANEEIAALKQLLKREREASKCAAAHVLESEFQVAKERDAAVTRAGELEATVAALNIQINSERDSTRKERDARVDMEKLVDQWTEAYNRDVEEEKVTVSALRKELAELKLKHASDIADLTLANQQMKSKLEVMEADSKKQADAAASEVALMRAELLRLSGTPPAPAAAKPCDRSLQLLQSQVDALTSQLAQAHATRTSMSNTIAHLQHEVNTLTEQLQQGDLAVHTFANAPVGTGSSSASSASSATAADQHDPQDPDRLTKTNVAALREAVAASDLAIQDLSSVAQRVIEKLSAEQRASNEFRILKAWYGLTHVSKELGSGFDQHPGCWEDVTETVAKLVQKKDKWYKLDVEVSDSQFSITAATHPLIATSKSLRAIEVHYMLNNQHCISPWVLDVRAKPVIDAIATRAAIVAALAVEPTHPCGRWTIEGTSM